MDSFGYFLIAALVFLVSCVLFTKFNWFNFRDGLLNKRCSGAAEIYAGIVCSLILGLGWPVAVPACLVIGTIIVVLRKFAKKWEDR